MRPAHFAGRVSALIQDSLTRAKSVASSRALEASSLEHAMSALASASSIPGQRSSRAAVETVHALDAQVKFLLNALQLLTTTTAQTRAEQQAAFLSLQMQQRTAMAAMHATQDAAIAQKIMNCYATARTLHDQAAAAAATAAATTIAPLAALSKASAAADAYDIGLSAPPVPADAKRGGSVQDLAAQRAAAAEAKAKAAAERRAQRQAAAEAQARIKAERSAAQSAADKAKAAAAKAEKEAAEANAKARAERLAAQKAAAEAKAQEALAKAQAQAERDAATRAAFAQARLEGRAQAKAERLAARQAAAEVMESVMREHARQVRHDDSDLF